MRLIVRMAAPVLAVLFGSCNGGSPVAAVPAGPPACPSLPAAGTRQTLTRSDLAVANAGGQCRERGGIPVAVSAGGVLDARVTWSDSRAVLTIEVWRGSLFERLATGQRPGEALCSTTSVPVEPGRYALVVCHTEASQVPVSLTTFTAFEVTALHP